MEFTVPSIFAMFRTADLLYFSDMHMFPETTRNVCVVIAAYNSAATIARAIRSALAEPEVTEVIVVDDASTDSTVKAAHASDDGTGRLKVLALNKNCGPSTARNTAFRESKASWICILDADDFFLPGRIRGLFTYAWDVDFIADDMWQVSENNTDGMRRSMLGDKLSGPRLVSFRDFVLSNVTENNRDDRHELGFIKPLMRREFLERHNLRYNEDMRLGEDFDLYARALALGARMILVPPQGYVSVIRAASLSSQHTITDLLHLRDCGQKILRDFSLSQEDRDALHKHYLSVDCRLQWRRLIEAVKNRNAKAAADTFRRPYPVPLYLSRQLLTQCCMRTLKLFRRSWPKKEETMSGTYPPAGSARRQSR